MSLPGDSNVRDIIKYNIKKNQLHGIEVDTKMYVLAAANMIMRGDGAASIVKSDAFTENEIYKVKYDRLLINPDFTYKENGLPFFLVGLNALKKMVSVLLLFKIVQEVEKELLLRRKS